MLAVVPPVTADASRRRSRAALEITRAVAATFCDACRFMDPVLPPGSAEDDDPGVDAGAGQCHRHLLVPGTLGLRLLPVDELTAAARAGAAPFLPPPEFGCVQWMPRPGVTEATPARLTDLPALEVRLGAWHAAFPGAARALLDDPGGLPGLAALEGLRFRDGTLFLGLMPGAVTRPALLAALAALEAAGS